MNKRDLDRWITGNGGEDQYKDEPKHGGPIVDFVLDRFRDLLNPAKACKCDDFGGSVHRVDGDDSYRCTECNEIIKNPIGCLLCSRYGKSWVCR